MLVTLKELLDQAKVEHKAVGAFNGTTLEAIRGIIQAAEELNAPVILQHAQSHDDLIDLEEIGPVMKYYAERAKVPVALHLDHGSSFERCVQALRLGFTSVMYDASAKSFEENAAETAEIVKIAHAVGASVEAELGHIFTSEVVQGEGAGADSTDDYEDLDNIYTDPEVAKKFVEMTNVDCLAVAFGTTHGVYLTEPKLDSTKKDSLKKEGVKMAVYKETIMLKSHGKTPTYVNITPQVREAIEKSGIQNGICTVISPHTTCSVFFEEFVHDYNEAGDEFLQEDLNNVLKKIIPDHVSADQYNYPGEEHYKAVESWPDADTYLPNGDRTALFNGDAHLRSTLIGSSATLEVDEGKLGVGATGYVYFVDFDRTRERTRKCKIIVIGE